MWLLAGWLRGLRRGRPWVGVPLDAGALLVRLLVALEQDDECRELVAIALYEHRRHGRCREVLSGFEQSLFSANGAVRTRLSTHQRRNGTLRVQNDDECVSHG